MSSLDLPVRPARPPTPVARSPAETARARLTRVPVPPEATAGTPYYDDEFNMPQSPAHSRMIQDLAQFLRQVADGAGLEVLSDSPVRYWIPGAPEPSWLYPDYALAEPVDPERALATDLRVALEVVSTERAEKERKDSERMRMLNAANGVPEFALLYPEPDDPRALRWFVLEDGAGVYREVAMPADRRFRSRAVPGLALEVLEPTRWEPGRKVRWWYRDERLPAIGEAKVWAREAERQAAEERQSRAAAERRAAAEARQAEDERRARAAAEAENARLLARLRQAGLSPD